MWVIERDIVSVEQINFPLPSLLPQAEDDKLTFGTPVEHPWFPTTSVPTLSYETRFHHLYVVGKSGMGKSTTLEAMVVKDLQMRRPVGMWVMSPEQEFFDRLLPHIPKHRAPHLIYINPMDHQPPIVGINLFDFELPDNLDPEERIGRIRQGASEIFTTLERAAGDLAATRSLRHTLDQAVMALAQRPHSTIKDLPRLIHPTNPSLRREIVRDTRILEQTREFWREYDERKTYSQYAENLLSRYRALLFPPLVNFLTTKGFSFHEALNLQPSIFFVNLSQLGEADRSLVAELLLSYLQQILLRRDKIAPQRRIPYFAYFDEFQRYAAVSELSIQGLFQQMRKYRFALTLAHQNPDDLKGSILSTILGTVGTLVILRMSGKDAGAMARETLFTDIEGRMRPDVIQQLPRGDAVIATNDNPRGIWTQITPPPKSHTGLKDPRLLIAYSKRRYGGMPERKEKEFTHAEEEAEGATESSLQTHTPSTPKRTPTPRKRTRARLRVPLLDDDDDRTSRDMV